MATLEQLAEGIKRAHAAGDENAVRVLGSEYRRMQGGSDVSAEAIPEQPVSPNVAERLGQATASTLTGLSQGATLGAYDEFASFLGAPVKGIENLVTGQDQIAGPGDILPFLGRSFQDALQGQQALNKQAFEQAPISYIGGDVLGAGGTALGLAGTGATTFGQVARPTVLNMMGRGALEGGVSGAGTGFNIGGPEGDTSLDARLRAAAEGGVAGALVGGATGGVLGGLAGRAQTNAIPSVEELAEQAGALYESARASGVTATPQMSQNIANTIESIARSENVRLPSGKVNSTYPKLSGVLNVFEEYSGLPLDVGRMQSIRRNLQDAAKSLDKGERRVATIMLGEFDDFAATVAPELAEASDLYWRAKLGETIEQAIELADNRSSQFSQSGMENALRTQFRQLNAKIIKGQLKGIPPELAEQIALVAEGSPIQNFARGIGKFAVRGPVSALVPTIAGGAGFGAGGPAGAALGAGAVAIPGEVGRALAERISVRNADVASALARSGGQLPSWEFAPAAGALVQALSAAPSHIRAQF